MFFRSHHSVRSDTIRPTLAARHAGIIAASNAATPTSAIANVSAVEFFAFACGLSGWKVRRSARAAGERSTRVR